ncbi:hypothetical protein ACTL32_08680 [Planococcus sp. FY231025]|uniref:hypothetical protein n=1 Tax=Planococcus sp. FY231025 TaxID=3455699 RepID=UPI003F8FC5FE
MYYFMLLLGFFFILIAIGAIVFLFKQKEFKFLDVGKILFALLIGNFLLIITVPSLKSILFEEYDVVEGECSIEIISSGRYTETEITLLETDEWFTFSDVPELDAYGKSIPYYCEVTLTEDHEFGISYKIFDASSRELLITNK